MPRKDEKVDEILAYTLELVQRAQGPEESSEFVVEAVMLCAAKVQDLTTPESAHSLAVTRMVQEADLGSAETLRRIRGVLRAATQLDGLNRDLHPKNQAAAAPQPTA
jgi:hypothetical protein